MCALLPCAIVRHGAHDAGGKSTQCEQDTSPPRDNTVLVAVARDGGAQLFSCGRLSLVVGALMRLPADEAEPFLRSGVLVLHDRGGGGE
jgi:hypothetical protein